MYWMRKVGLYMLTVGICGFIATMHYKTESGVFYTEALMFHIMLSICGLLYLLFGKTLVKVIRTQTVMILENIDPR